jgi:hypothetical protein
MTDSRLARRVQTVGMNSRVERSQLCHAKKDQGAQGILHYTDSMQRSTGREPITARFLHVRSTRILNNPSSWSHEFGQPFPPGLTYIFWSK